MNISKLNLCQRLILYFGVPVLGGRGQGQGHLARYHGAVGILNLNNVARSIKVDRQERQAHELKLDSTVSLAADARSALAHQERE